MDHCYNEKPTASSRRVKFWTAASKFELQSGYNIHFRTYPWVKYEPAYLP